MAQIVTTSELPGVTSRQPDSDDLAGRVIEETGVRCPKTFREITPRLSGRGTLAILW